VKHTELKATRLNPLEFPCRLDAGNSVNLWRCEKSTTYDLPLIGATYQRLPLLPIDLTGSFAGGRSYHR
jgi:hypothetical protein